MQDLVNTDLVQKSFRVRPESANSGIAHQQPGPDTENGIAPLAVGEQVARYGSTSKRSPE